MIDYEGTHPIQNITNFGTVNLFSDLFNNLSLTNFGTITAHVTSAETNGAFAIINNQGLYIQDSNDLRFDPLYTIASGSTVRINPQATASFLSPLFSTDKRLTNRGTFEILSQIDQVSWIPFSENAFYIEGATVNYGHIDFSIDSPNAQVVDSFLGSVIQNIDANPLGKTTFSEGTFVQSFGEESVLRGGTLENQARFTIEGSLLLDLEAVLENRGVGLGALSDPGLKVSGLLELTQGTRLDNIEGTAGNFGTIVANEALIRNQSDASIDFDLPDFYNEGSIQLDESQLHNMAGRFLNVGAIDVENNSDLVNYGNMQNLGAINADSTSQIVNAAGGLFVNIGTISGTFVNNGLLKGVGSFDTLTGSGTFAFGFSPGVAATDNFIPSIGATYEVSLDGTIGCASNCEAGFFTEYTQLLVSGTLDLTATSLILDLDFGFTPDVGDYFDLIAYNTFAGGEFNDILLPSGFAVSINDEYSGAGFDDYDYTVRLTILDNEVPIPEPETYLTLGSFLLAAYLLRGKKRALAKSKDT